MDYTPGYVYKLMEKGGPTDVREPYFKEAMLHVPLCSGSRRKQHRASKYGLASVSFSNLSHSSVEIPISPQLYSPLEFTVLYSVSIFI